MEATVGTLIALDEVYSKIETELRDKILALRYEYQPKFDAVLADRTVELEKKDASSKVDAKSTPALPNFWMDVLANSEEFRDEIEEYDEPVLEYLESITGADLDPTDENKGFSLTFKFNPNNPYFTNTELTKIYTSGRTNEFTDQLEIIKIESDKIEWNQGKDVTVEMVTKKKSGGGAKKKAPASKAEPRPSFFRYFRDLDADNLPSEMGDFEPDEDDDQDEAEREMEQLQMIMESDWERASSLKELIIPRAIRWYTGEAVMDDDAEEEDEDDEDDEDDDYEDEEDDESPKDKKLFPKVGQNPEECKQQ